MVVTAADDARGAHPERCEGCGLVVPGGTSGCQALMDELLARDFSDVLYFRVHRLMVDTYALQHPERYCASAKSLAAHLAGLCSILEFGGNRATGSDALRKSLDGGRMDLEKPEIPARRGELTIADVRGAAGPVAYGDAVERWARSTWDAYTPLQELARSWTEAALGSR